MLELRKTMTAVLSLSSSLLWAGTMGPVCVKGNVTIPCAQSGWEVGAQALYLQPEYSGLDYLFFNTNADGSIQKNLPMDPSWAWGFKVDAAYYFNTGNDVNINWYHLDNKNTNSITTANMYTGDLGAFAATSQVGTRWDAVNLELGQFMEFDDLKNVRFHAGLEYANLGFNGLYKSVVLDQCLSAHLRYNGVGPRVGADGAYGFGNNFSVYANGAASILMGHGSFNTFWNAPRAPAPAPSSTYISGGRTQITPELETKLGAKYAFAFAQGNVGIDAGWMWTNYFNAFAQGQGGSEQNSALLTDFAVSGPYVGLKWMGNL